MTVGYGYTVLPPNGTDRQIDGQIATLPYAPYSRAEIYKRQTGCRGGRSSEVGPADDVEKARDGEKTS